MVAKQWCLLLRLLTSPWYRRFLIGIDELPVYMFNQLFYIYLFRYMNTLSGCALMKVSASGVWMIVGCFFLLFRPFFFFFFSFFFVFFVCCCNMNVGYVCSKITEKHMSNWTLWLSVAIYIEVIPAGIAPSNIATDGQRVSTQIILILVKHVCPLSCLQHCCTNCVGFCKAFSHVLLTEPKMCWAMILDLNSLTTTQV